MKFEWLKPYVEGARAVAVDWGCTRYLLEYKTREDFEALIADVEEKGITVAQQHAIGDNLFATVRTADGDVAISYADWIHTIFVIADEMCDGRRAPALASSAYEVLTEPKLAMLGLDYSNPEKDGASGMCFVFTLSDGSFIVYDGGYAEDAIVLLDYLEKNNVRTEKPRVAAWVLTHSHPDHYMAVAEMAEKYADRLTVEEFVLNPRLSKYEFEEYEGFLGEVFPKEVLPKFAGAVMVKPHSGQKLCYRDADIEILHTQEDLLPSHFRTLNDLSLVSRVILGGQSTLLLVDGEVSLDTTLPGLYGYALESDFLQIPNHAKSTSGSYPLYDTVLPRVCLFACGTEAFEKYSQRSKNRYLIAMAQECHYSGEGTTVFTLPYALTPRKEYGAVDTFGKGFEFLAPYVQGARVLNVDWGSIRYILYRKTREDFEAIVSALAGEGLTVAQRHTIGNNEFATLRGEMGDISVGYFNYNRTVCLVSDEMTEGRALPPLAPTSYETLTTPKLALIGLDYRNPNGGMSMVMTLSDGSYIIYDGALTVDAPILLDYLEKNNVRAEKPRVAAWVITHSHGDHYQALRKIANTTPERITVEDFILAPRLSKYEGEQYEPYLGEIFPIETLPKFEGARMVKPHTGQLLHYRDAQIEIFHTQEEILPSQFSWMNEVSTLTRVFLGGQRILLPADGEIGTDILFPTTYGYALESEFVQNPHHGFSGGSYTLYDAVRPQVALFTCEQAGFDKQTAWDWRNGQNYYLVQIAKETYHSGMGTTVFELPYTPKK